jgi:hypothetical protein
MGSLLLIKTPRPTVVEPGENHDKRHSTHRDRSSLKTNPVITP